jgi:hypothetical protein
VPDLSTIFDHELDFDPVAPDLDVWLKQVPGRWVVYLFAGADDSPIQLLCVKNLRSSLKRRLSGEEMLGPTKRVNYREVVRRIHWRRVDSAFEADMVYLDAARQLFPHNYQSLVGFRPAWFVHVNPEADFPRYTKTSDLSAKAGIYLGPIEDKTSAAHLVELAEDTFDLCRYYNILIQAPHAKACPYKDMGKCPAPCDGSISMSDYRAMIRRSVQALANPSRVIAEQTQRMQQAAADLRFEEAAKAKALLDKLSQLSKGAYRHVATLDDFAFLSLQRGPWAHTAKLFLITLWQIEELAGLPNTSSPPLDIPSMALDRARQHRADASVASSDPAAAERLGVVSHHLFAPLKQASGVFLRLCDLDDKAFIKACRDLQKQKAEAESEGEGVVKELQST